MNSKNARPPKTNTLTNIRTLLCMYTKGKTIISIAHRVSSIENADEILVINQGQLADCGKHSDLLHSSKIYSLLYKEESEG